MVTTRQNGFRRLSALLAILIVAAGLDPSTARPDDEPEFAPIIGRTLDFYDFTLKTPAGSLFNLRDYTNGKRLVMVCFVAGWCPNSNRNGHVIKQLYDKYHERGLGVVVVSEYSTPDELRIHINRIGIEYPVVVDTNRLGERKDSLHYKLRRQAQDKRKWGTPFYVLIEAKDIDPSAPKAPLARHVFTVSGEIIGHEAESFIEQRLVNQ
jgi:peroxiredoxin